MKVERHKVNLDDDLQSGKLAVAGETVTNALAAAVGIMLRPPNRSGRFRGKGIVVANLTTSGSSHFGLDGWG